MPTNPKGYMQRYRRMRWDKLRIEFGNRCSICLGHRCNNLNLQFAHIKPTLLNGMGRGLENRFYDILRNKSCYALMGAMCHRYYDAINGNHIKTVHQFD